MIDKSKYICTTPFFFTEVEDNKQFLCCPSWLSTDINSGKGILDSFNSEIAEKIRDSVTEITLGVRYSIVSWYCKPQNHIDTKIISLI